MAARIEMSNAPIAILFYAGLGLAFTLCLGATLASEPLFPFQMGSLSWTAAWLLTTVADYYVSTLCLCGVIFASEPFGIAVLWSLGTCLLGSPVCCAFVISRLVRHRTLRLCDSRTMLAMD